MTEADLEYISSNYLTLEQLCDGRAESPHELRSLIAARRLPEPSYVLPDGTGMFPADYFRLVDEAGGAAGPRADGCPVRGGGGGGVPAGLGGGGAEADVAAAAALLAEPARAALVVALTEQETLPASALAAHAGIAPSTASEHLRKLVAGGFL